LQNDPEDLLTNNNKYNGNKKMNGIIDNTIDNDIENNVDKDVDEL